MKGRNVWEEIFGGFDENSEKKIWIVFALNEVFSSI